MTAHPTRNVACPLRWWIALGLLLGGLWTPVASGEEGRAAAASWSLSLHGDRLSVHLDRAPLGLVLAELARQGGFRVHLSTGVEAAVLSTTFERLPLDEGIERLLAGWSHVVLYAPGSEARGPGPLRIAALLVLAPAGPPLRDSHAGGAAGLAAALASPDPQVRIQALEEWAAQREGPGVDPLTYAMVDPDEQVRARAQQLLDEVWSGEAPEQSSDSSPPVAERPR